jgi:hypothetical protein
VCEGELCGVNANVGTLRIQYTTTTCAALHECAVFIQGLGDSASVLHTFGWLVTRGAKPYCGKKCILRKFIRMQQMQHSHG